MVVHEVGQEFSVKDAVVAVYDVNQEQFLKDSVITHFLSFFVNQNVQMTKIISNFDSMPFTVQNQFTLSLTPAVTNSCTVSHPFFD